MLKKEDSSLCFHMGKIINQINFLENQMPNNMLHAQDLDVKRVKPQKKVAAHFLSFTKRPTWVQPILECTLLSMARMGKIS